MQAYDDEDPDLARRALASPFIKSMDVEYARLARDLKLPKGLVSNPKVPVIENATSSYVSPGGEIDHQQPAQHEEEEEEGGLC